MPKMICPEGHRWEKLAYHVGKACPECGLVSDTDLSAEFGPSLGRTDMGFDYSRLENPKTPEDRQELQAALEHKAWLESTESQRDSGQLTVKEAGPDWLRPFENRPREKKFY